MSTLSTATAVLKQLGSYSAALYAFGFLAVHARLNALGAWSQLPLIDDQYLTEGALVLVSTLLNVLFPYALTLLLPAAVGLLVLRRFPSTRVQRLQKALAEGAWAQITTLIVLMLLAFNCAAAELGTTGLLLADGERELAGSWRSMSPGARANLYGAISLLTIAAALAARWMQARPAMPRAFRTTAVLLALLLVVLLPFNFAVLQRTSEFPLATLVLAERQQPLRGALLFRGADQIVLRDLEGGILTLARKDVRELRITSYVTLERLQSGGVE